MTTPYILPSMLNNLAPLGIDWESIPIAGATEAQNQAALLDICYIASDCIDTECFQPLRATCDVDELIGPDQRLTVNPNFTLALMDHWPIIAALGAQWAPSGQFPPSFQSIPASSLVVSQLSSQFLGGSFLGSSGSDGMNEINIENGFISWQNGRNGCRLQIAYENGWPTAGILPAAEVAGTLAEGEIVVTDCSDTTGVLVGAPIVCLDSIPSGTTVTGVTSDTITLSQPANVDLTGAALQIGYIAGVSMLNVDDVTGMVGTGPTIFDGGSSEGTRIIDSAALDMVEVLPGIFATIGPGTVTLARPTRLAHLGTAPAQALLSSIPSNVRQAGYYYAGAQALQRGGTAFTVQALPGSLQSSGGTPSIGDWTAQAQNQLKNFKRIF